MSRRVRILRVVIISGLFVVPAFARPPHAPDDQYDLFDSKATVIIDKQTNLRWERFIPLQPRTLGDASIYCAALPLDGGQWRLPTVKELLTLLDEEPHDEYDGALVTKMIDPDAFSDAKTPVDVVYWTSTPAGPASSGSRWTLDFKTGAMTVASPSTSLHYRCVK